jgi:hypothetical protein
VIAVAAASGAVTGADVEPRSTQQAGGTVLGKHRDQRGRRRLHRLRRAVAVGLELPDAPGEHSSIETPADRVDVLEPVEQRQDDSRTRLDPAQGVIETGRLHRDEQQLDGLVQLLDGAWPHGPDLGATSQRKSVGRDRSDRGGPGDAHHVQARLGKRDGERSPDSPGSQHADRARSRHVFKTHVQVSDTVTKV